MSMLFDKFDGTARPAPAVPALRGFVARPYQAEAIAACQESLKDGGRAMLVLATGLGKTEVFCEIARTWTNGRTLVIAPQICLVDQAAEKLELRTGIPPSIEQANRWSNEQPWARGDFVVASKQTLTTKNKQSGEHRYERFRDVGLVVVDECHGGLTKHMKGMLDWFGDNGAAILGVTATPKRHDKRALGIVYQSCPYQYEIADAVADGWLVPALVRCVQIESLDLSKVKKSNGDYQQGELAKAMEDDKTIFEVAGVAAEETRGLRTVVYCASVDEAKGVADRLIDTHGIKAAWICSDKTRCSDQRRAEVMAGFETGEITHLCNVGILTTGWDFPELEAIVMARPTRSKPLYTQIFGRGTRPLPGVVDFAGSTAESRRAAIAASDKPNFRMVDLVDASLDHKLVTSLDVLGGNYSLEDIQAARVEATKNNQGVSVEAALAQAKTRREEEEEKRREKRRQHAASVKYRAQEVDPFGRREVASQRRKKPGARMPFGKHKGKLVSEVPSGYLRWLTENNPPRAGWLKVEIERVLGEPVKAAEPAPVAAEKSIDDINAMLMLD